MATAAQSAHPDGLYISATTTTLRKAKYFLYLMQRAGY
jgi:hypothetical protein